MYFKYWEWTQGTRYCTILIENFYFSITNNYLRKFNEDLAVPVTGKCNNFGGTNIFSIFVIIINFATTLSDLFVRVINQEA